MRKKEKKTNDFFTDSYWIWTIRESTTIGLDCRCFFLATAISRRLANGIEANGVRVQHQMEHIAGKKTEPRKSSTAPAVSTNVCQCN